MTGLVRVVGVSTKPFDRLAVQAAAKGGNVVVTNQALAVSCILAWPSVNSDYTVYYKDDLNPAAVAAGQGLVVLPEFWQPVRGSPVAANGFNMITDIGPRSLRYYQLRRR